MRLTLIPRDRGRTFREEASSPGVLIFSALGVGLWLVTDFQGYLLWPVAALIGARLRSRGSRRTSDRSRWTPPGAGAAGPSA